MESDTAEVLRGLANQYPADLIDEEIKDIPRTAFNIGLALESSVSKRPSDMELCDLGGGVGLLSVGCAALGMKRVVLVDDFSDEINFRIGDSILNLHRDRGVEVISRDLIANGISDISGRFDVVTSFDSIEHWHHSPKGLFREVQRKLKPGGVFVLGAPNCVNLRKRLTVLFGKGKWSGMRDWYEAPIFRGHVREPDVDDLKYISRSMGLEVARIIGRNWAGLRSPNSAIKFATTCFDYALRLRPSLCSDIYLVARKSRESPTNALAPRP